MGLLAGTDAAETLDGGAGSDTLLGNAGDDVLRGYGSGDFLDGGDGNDTLRGGTADDTLQGGSGDDEYWVASALDAVLEAVDGGNDTIRSVVDFTLSANVEALRLAGTLAIHGTGNLLANRMTGNDASNRLSGLDGNDTLDALAGDDTLEGGAGSDLLSAGSGDDRLDGGEGNDLLYGRAGDDVLEGGGGADWLRGNFGSDTLAGGAGSDTLAGGGGDDTYRFGRGDAVDQVVDQAADAVDSLQFGAGIGHRQLWFTESAGDLQVSVLGTADSVTLKNYTAMTQSWQFLLDDGTAIGRGEIDALVDAMAGLAPPTGPEIPGTGDDASLAGVVDSVWLGLPGGDGDRLQRVGDEFRVNAYTPSSQRSSDVASLADGGFVVVFQSFQQDGNGEGVYAQRFDADGHAAGAVQRVNVTVAGNQQQPAVTGLADGGFLVAWNTYLGTDNGIFARRFDANGVAVGGEFTVSPAEQVNTAQPDVAALADGRWLVAWTAEGDVYGSIYGADGTPAESGIPLSGAAVPAFAVVTPAVAALPDGGFVTYWGDGSPGGVVYGPEVEAGPRLALTGHPTTGPAGVAALADGSSVSNWTQGSTVYVQITDAAGNALAPVTVNTPANESVHGSQVLALSDGTFVVAWHAEHLDGSGRGALARRFDADGAPLSDEFLLSTRTLDHQANPALAALADGGFVATWESEYQDGASYGIYAQRFGFGVDLPPTDIALSATHVGEHAGEIGVLSVTGDPDGGEVRWKLLDNPADIFAIDGDRLVVAHRELLDADAGAAAFTLRVGAADLSGDVMREREFTITVEQAAELVAAGAEIPVGTGSGYLDAPSVAALADGGYVVAWDQQTPLDGDRDGCLVQRFNGDGEAVGVPQRVNTYTAGSQEYTAVAGLADGGFVVLWESATQDAGTYGVYGQRYSADGAATGSEFQVNTWSTGVQRQAEVAALPDGGFVAAWYSTTQDGNSGGIYARRYGADGSAGEEFRVNTVSDNEQSEPSLAVLADGGFIVTWSSTSTSASASGRGIFAQRYDEDGQAVGGQFRASLSVSDGWRDSHVVALRDGGFAVTWMASDAGIEQGIRGRVFGADGVAVSGELHVNSTRTEDQSSPFGVALPDGGFLVAWTSPAHEPDITLPGGVLDVTNDGIEAQRFDALGRPVGAEFHVNTLTDYDQGSSAGALLADGSVLLAWSSALQLGSQRFVLEPAEFAAASVFAGEDYYAVTDGDSGALPTNAEPLPG